MSSKRRFFPIAACAVMMLGLSTAASANITGTGCIVSGTAGQTLRLPLWQISAGCPAAGAANL